MRGKIGGGVSGVKGPPVYCQGRGSVVGEGRDWVISGVGKALCDLGEGCDVGGKGRYLGGSGENSPLPPCDLGEAVIWGRGVSSEGNTPCTIWGNGGFLDWGREEIEGNSGGGDPIFLHVILQGLCWGGGLSLGEGEAWGGSLGWLGPLCGVGEGRRG